MAPTAPTSGPKASSTHSGTSARRPACRAGSSIARRRPVPRHPHAAASTTASSYTMTGKRGGARSAWADSARPRARRADVLPLSRTPGTTSWATMRDQLPRAAARADARPRSRPSGWSTRMRSKASTTTSKTLTEVWRHQRSGPPHRRGEPARHRSPAYEPGPYSVDARGRRDAVRRLVHADHDLPPWRRRRPAKKRCLILTREAGEGDRR